MKPGDGILSLVTPPSAEIMPLDEAKAHCNIADDTSHDGEIIAAMIAARQHVENVTARSIITQTWDWLVPDFGYWRGVYRFDGTRYPGVSCCPAFKIPRPPLISITHLQYLDADGAEQIVDAANYRVIAPAGPLADYGTLDPINSYSWPSLIAQRDAVRIRFVAGYGGPENCPEPIRQAVKLLTSDFFENREAQLVGVGIAENPAVMRLLDHYIARG